MIWVGLENLQVVSCEDLACDGLLTWYRDNATFQYDSSFMPQIQMNDPVQCVSMTSSKFTKHLVVS